MLDIYIGMQMKFRHNSLVEKHHIDKVSCEINLQFSQSFTLLLKHVFSTDMEIIAQSGCGITRFYLIVKRVNTNCYNGRDLHKLS